MYLIASLVNLQCLLLVDPGRDGLVPLSMLAATAAIALVLASILACDQVRRLTRPATPHTGPVSLRRRCQRVIVVPQRDPDARGRTRPRAPTSNRRQRDMDALAPARLTV